jgi:hypothetical protein
VDLPSVSFMTKHNEQHLPVLSFSNAPQAKNLGSGYLPAAALYLLSSANRESDVQHRHERTSSTRQVL